MKAKNRILWISNPPNIIYVTPLNSPLHKTRLNLGKPPIGGTSPSQIAFYLKSFLRKLINET